MRLSSTGIPILAPGESVAVDIYTIPNIVSRYSSGTIIHPPLPQYGWLIGNPVRVAAQNMPGFVLGNKGFNLVGSVSVNGWVDDTFVFGNVLTHPITVDYHGVLTASNQLGVIATEIDLSYSVAMGASVQYPGNSVELNSGAFLASSRFIVGGAVQIPTTVNMYKSVGSATLPITLAGGVVPPNIQFPFYIWLGDFPARIYPEPQFRNDPYNATYYSSTVNYVIGDLSRSYIDHDLYECVTASVGNEPSASPGYWSIMQSPPLGILGDRAANTPSWTQMGTGLFTTVMTIPGRLFGNFQSMFGDYGTTTNYTLTLFCEQDDYLLNPRQTFTIAFIN